LTELDHPWVGAWRWSWGSK